MVSHPETSSDSPIGSDRDRGHDKVCSVNQNAGKLNVQELQEIPN